MRFQRARQLVAGHLGVRRDLLLQPHDDLVGQPRPLRLDQPDQMQGVRVQRHRSVSPIVQLLASW